MRSDPRRLPPLDPLVAFEAAARHLSFTQAAAERFLTQSAVSRQVAALEADLGAALFHRRHRALELTEEGTRLAAAVGSALATLREAAQAIRAPRERQVIALTTTPGFASLWLIPRLAQFVNAHPGVDVRIDASFERRALATDGFDIAVRYGPLAGADGTPLFGEAVLPVCAPGLLQGGNGHRPLKRPADLLTHTLLQVQLPHAGAPGMPLEWHAWLEAAGVSSHESAGTLTFSSYDAAVAAALEGQGVVLGRRPLIDRLLEQKRLVAPFKGQVASARGYFVVVDDLAARRPAVRALAEWLQQQAAAPTDAPAPAVAAPPRARRPRRG
jgi:LysR family transcriptional regulator, glycine cleavage system transcriptional activator